MKDYLVAQVRELKERNLTATQIAHRLHIGVGTVYLILETLKGFLQ